MSDDVAVFLDLDNVVIGAQEARLPFDINVIIKCIRDTTNGRIVLRRAYGDWRRNPKIPESLATAGFELQASVRLGTVSKNLADMQMVVDVMETLIYGHNFGTYVIVSGDRDFVPLVQALRKRGKQVIGIGLKHTSSRSLVGLCDRYIFYEELVERPRELEDKEVSGLIEQALDELLQDQPRVPASLLKQRMQQLSKGLFAESRFGKRSFSAVLEEYPRVVQLEREGTTLFARRSGSAPVVAEPEPEPRRLPEDEVIQLLRTAFRELQGGQGRVRASLLKQRMQELSHGVFSETLQGDDSFRRFLERYPQMVSLEKGGSTLYVTEPPAGQAGELHKQYRTTLKKTGLRVMPANIRLMVLKDLLAYLQDDNDARWGALIDTLYDRYRRARIADISKNVIGDVLRVARRAEIIEVVSNSPSLKTAEIRLQLASERPFQDAVMRCDAAYLQQIEALEAPLDLEQVAIALYDSPAHARYLKILQNRYRDNGHV